MKLLEEFQEYCHCMKNDKISLLGYAPIAIMIAAECAEQMLEAPGLKDTMAAIQQMGFGTTFGAMAVTGAGIPTLRTYKRIEDMVDKHGPKYVERLKKSQNLNWSQLAAIKAYEAKLEEKVHEKPLQETKLEDQIVESTYQFLEGGH